MKTLLYSFALTALLLGALTDAQAQARRRLRVLFIGNSYTQYNNLPNMVAQVAASVGDTVTQSSNMIGGYRLSEHFTNATTLALIRRGNWDRVVLQEQSQLPSFPMHQVQATFFRSGHQLDSIIKAHNPRARTYLYVTWGRRDGDNGNCAALPWVCNYWDMDSTIRLRYETLARQEDAALAPVGPVWRRLRRTYPSLNLYDPDGSHPSLAGSYVAACTMYTTLFGKNITGVTYRAGLPPSTVDSIHKAVKRVAYDSLAYWRVAVPTAATPAAGQEAVAAWPNPTSGLLYLNAPDAAQATLTDGTGRTVRRWKPGQGPLNMAALPAGVYHLWVQTAGGKSRYRRIVRQ